MPQEVTPVAEVSATPTVQFTSALPVAGAEPEPVSASPAVTAPEAAKGIQAAAAGGRKKPAMPAAALIQKKAPRRGIRLKTDADDGPGYD